MLAVTALWAVMEYASPDHDHENYIKKYSGLAVQEMERTGIPASIKLAQAILESDAGRSTLATRARNHFGIKCGGKWNGRSYYKKDDDYVNGRLVKSCFRSYPEVYQSFVDHSEFLRHGKRYQFLFELDQTNYKAWARGLKKAGYATSPYYHKRLIGLIERYELYQYDTYARNHTPREEAKMLAKAEQRFLTRNDVDYLLAREGQTVAELARRADISSKRLLRYNEELRSSDQALSNGDIVFLQRKRKHWRGKATWHLVKSGEDMYDIAQRYGLRLDKLYQRNLLPEGSRPAPGQRIKIRGGQVDEPPRQYAPEPTEPLDPLPERDAVESGEVFLWEEAEEAPLPPAIETPAADLPPLIETVSRTEPLPGPREEIPQPVLQAYHVVQPGETLWRISRMHAISVEELKRLNGLRSNTIRRGMKLRLR
jgi:LysM repeat protein